MQASLERTFGALADPTRVAVVALLRKRPHRSGDIAAALSMSRPAMSRHLRIMRKAGLVAVRRAEPESGLEDDARARMYQLRPERFSELRSWLEEVEAFWGDQLETFKTHVERKYGKRRR